MPRKTKYCLNFGKGKHLNDGKSPSNMHCSKCYDDVKTKYEVIENQGGRISGLRAARAFAGGSFGYERSKSERATNLMAFFNYVMPEIPIEQALILSRDLSEKATIELEDHKGNYKTVKIN